MFFDDLRNETKNCPEKDEKMYVCGNLWTFLDNNLHHSQTKIYFIVGNQIWNSNIKLSSWEIHLKTFSLGLSNIRWNDTFSYLKFNVQKKLFKLD